MKLITESSQLQCDKGTAPSLLAVTSQTFAHIEGKLQATEEDKQPNTNIKPFGICAITKVSCAPSPVKWNDVSVFEIEGKKELLENSTCQCAVGGKISVLQAAQTFVEEGGMTIEDAGDERLLEVQSSPGGLEPVPPEGRLYSNEAKAYTFMWNNSFRNKEPWMENGGWLTDHGVLVAPITKENRVNNWDYHALPTKVSGEKSFVKHNNAWLKMKAMIHTHPSDPHSGFSQGDLDVTQDFHVPMFIIGHRRLLVGFGPSSNSAYNQIAGDRVPLLNGTLSIYRDILPQLPK